ncbi:hypothetical protein QQP08_001892 [Theobroma cacao]|nr:hypothetical protein QQP08_001892 [Theobroma cacao]
MGLWVKKKGNRGDLPLCPFKAMFCTTRQIRTEPLISFLFFGISMEDYLVLVVTGEVEVVGAIVLLGTPPFPPPTSWTASSFSTYDVKLIHFFENTKNKKTKGVVISFQRFHPMLKTQ